jgi:hypothetical protein
VNIVKSARYSKITGDFAEALVFYWLSRDGSISGVPLSSSPARGNAALDQR